MSPHIPTKVWSTLVSLAANAQVNNKAHEFVASGMEVSSGIEAQMAVRAARAISFLVPGHENAYPFAEEEALDVVERIARRRV
jgi:hypothetical protein